ncbi:protein phosphatase 2C domain-containing protein [Kitasatospora sp. NPDC057500]|uniref:protein phosphatase 2C domain-containing protein n=1 Tax=Kitasatospora sp. NPDC057500 TaxID=3346151 RepID=UPI0036C1EFE7
MLTALRASVASQARPGARNEDFVLAAADVVVLLDGAGLPAVLDSGCVHGVPWFVRTLGTALHRLAADRHTGLRECLAAAIRLTARAHADSCDLGSTLTPSATVAVARAGAERLEWLVLADCTLVLRLDAGDVRTGNAPTGSIRTVSDHRVSHVTTAQRAALAAEVDRLGPAERAAAFARAQRRVMNTAGGYWVAAADPAAAEEAYTGSVPLDRLRAAALLTDGAARPVDDFGVHSWPELLDRLEAHGPRHLIARTRELERSDPDCRRWPRSKCHDDATAVLLLPRTAPG